ncbi:TetR/AcrR family transcriptional regulator [Salinarchaeum chitinilyticum]
MDDPAEDIMGATFRALCEHGYADLTMRDIAEESDRSKAALHYHYDDKEGLLVAFLEHLYDSFDDRLGEYRLDAAREDDAEAARTVDADVDPDEQLRAFIDAALHPPADGDAREFRTALMEIKAQVPYQDAFQEQIRQFDEFVTTTVSALVAAGQAEGIYRDSVDPDHVGQFVLTVFDGAGTRHVVADAPVECAIASLNDYVDDHLLVEGREPAASRAAGSAEPPVTDGSGEDGDDGSVAEGSQ